MTISNSNCAVIILAAGKGERMQSVGIKALLKIGGKPMVQYALELAREFQPQQTIVVFSDNATKSGVDLLKGSEKFVTIPPLGTLENTETVLKTAQLPDWLLICQSDDAVFYRSTVFQEVLECAINQNVNIAVTAVKTTAPLPLGSVEKNKDGLMTNFTFDRTLPPPKFVLSGIYLIKVETLRQFGPSVQPDNKGERSIVYLLKNAHDAGEPIAIKELPEGEWSNINTPEDLERARARMEDNA